MSIFFRRITTYLLSFASLLWSIPSLAQLNPAFTLNQGGFQVGSTFADNGWEAVNGSAVNGWALGGNYPGATGGRCAYLTSDYASANPSTTLVAATVSGQVVHLFRTLTLPATDSAIFIQFRLTSLLAGNVSLNVHLDTVLTPLVAGSVQGTPVWRMTTGLVNTGNFTDYTIQVPSLYAGKVVRLRFEYRPLSNLFNVTNARGYAIDDVGVFTRPYLGNTITAQAAGGGWSNPATWVGGLVPTIGEHVVIPAGATVTADAFGEPGGRNMTVQGVLSGVLTNPGTPGSINVWGSLTVTNTGQVQMSDRTVRVGGHLTAQPGAVLDLRRGSLMLDSTGLVTTQRVISLDSMGQFTNRVVATLSCFAPEGVRFQLSNANNDTLRVYFNLGLFNGVLSHGGRILLDNTLGAALAGGSNPPSFILSVSRGSLSSFPTLGSLCNLELRYSHSTTLANPLIAGSRNELPPNRRFGRLTVGSAFAYLRLVDDIWLTDNVSNTLWLFGPASVDPGKRITLLNTNATVFTGNQGLLQGKLVLTVNSSNELTRRFPVGLNGIPNHFELRGMTTTGEAKIGVEAVLPGGTPALVAPLTGLSPLARIRVTIDSGVVNTVSSVAAFYTVADGIEAPQVANLRVARSTTLAGSYSSIGPSTPPSASPVVSNTGSFASNAFYSLALEGGVFRKLWTGAAGTDSWDTPENWSGNTLPSCSDNVVLSPQFVTIRVSGDRQVGGLELGPQTTLELRSGSRLRIGCATGTGRLLINGFGGSGHFYGIRAMPGSTLRVE